MGYDSLDALIDDTVPAAIRRQQPMDLPGPQTEQAVSASCAAGQQNVVNKSFIGTGYHDTFTPAVIQRNVLENPGWYTAYTPYQPEISQGRLEALLTFQQMILDLTGMDLANASMLDEGTAAAEAMTLLHRVNKKNRSNTFLVADDCHPQTIAVVKTRAEALDIEVIVGSPRAAGQHRGLRPAAAIPRHLRPPGRYLAADRKGPRGQHPGRGSGRHHGTAAGEITRRTGRRRGGGQHPALWCAHGLWRPHAAYFATRDAYKRSTPGRIIGVSIDRRGNQALRMAMQTREQHIRREKATSNICTAQALLAIMATFYAMYHGPEGLRRIADRIHRLTCILASGLEHAGFKPTTTTTSTP